MTRCFAIAKYLTDEEIERAVRAVYIPMPRADDETKTILRTPNSWSCPLGVALEGLVTSTPDASEVSWVLYGRKPGGFWGIRRAARAFIMNWDENRIHGLAAAFGMSKPSCGKV